MADGAQNSSPDRETGLFIVLEGVDGAGTTTQSRHLAETLQNNGWRVHLTRQPSTGPVGKLLRQVLSGRLTISSAQDTNVPSFGAMALLFAADRLDHLQSEVEPRLEEGTTVICDRYDHSSLAYQSATAGGSPETMKWIREVNRFARRPDLTIVLDVSPAVARERRSDRPGREIYEDDRLQLTLCDLYRNIEQHFAEDRIVHVDADASFERVAQAILGHVQGLYRCR